MLVFKVYKFKIYNFKTIVKYFIDSTPFFLSRSLTVFLDRINIILIGILFKMDYVVFYDMGQKISNTLKIPINLINQTIYPNVSANKNMNIVINAIKICLIYALVSYLLLIFFSTDIIKIISGSKLSQANNVIIILNFTVVIAAITYFLGNTILVVKGFYKIFNTSIYIELLVYIVFIAAFFLLNYLTIEVVALSILVSNFCGMLFRYLSIKYYNLLSD